MARPAGLQLGLELGLPRRLAARLTTLRTPGQTEVVAIEGPRRDGTAPPAQTLLIVPAGLLIAIPGLLTTATGLVLWLPPIRARIAARIERAARRIRPPDGMPPPGWGTSP